MAENLCVKMGGGTQKWDLLWKNPNPTSALGATSVPIDATKYDAILILLKGHISYDVDRYGRFIQVKVGDTYIAISNPLSNFATWRSISVTNSAITFNASAGYRYYSDGGGANSTAYSIPVAIYGVKKVKLGE